MFDKFGEFDSAEEINRAVAAQLAEGDTEAILAIAEENGIDKEDAEDYINGYMDELVNPLMAAYGKLDVEAKELKPDGIMGDWLQYIKVRCSEDVNMAAAVRRKGKSLKGCITELMLWSFTNMKQVDKDIVALAKKKNKGLPDRISLGIPGMGRAKQIITDYYLKEENK